MAPSRSTTTGSTPVTPTAVFVPLAAPASRRCPRRAPMGWSDPACYYSLPGAVGARFAGTRRKPDRRAKAQPAGPAPKVGPSQLRIRPLGGEDGGRAVDVDLVIQPEDREPEDAQEDRLAENAGVLAARAV